MRDETPLCAVCDGTRMPGSPLPLCKNCIAKSYRFAATCRSANGVCRVCEEPIGVEAPPFPVCPSCARRIHDWVNVLMRVANRADRDIKAPRLNPVGHGATEVVYYVKFGNRVKIGTTTHLANRLQAIPHDDVLALEAGGRELEQARHAQFGEERLTGEWFHLSGRLLRHIMELRRQSA